MKYVKKNKKSLEDLQEQQQNDPEEIILQTTPKVADYLLAELKIISNELSLINKELRNIAKVIAVANDIEVENED